MKHRASAVVVVVGGGGGAFCRLEKGRILQDSVKNIRLHYFTNFQHKIIFVSEYQPAEFILKIFLKSRKLQPRYSYKIFPSIERKRVYPTEEGKTSERKRGKLYTSVVQQATD